MIFNFIETEILNSISSKEFIKDRNSVINKLSELLKYTEDFELCENIVSLRNKITNLTEKQFQYLILKIPVLNNFNYNLSVII